MVYAHVRISFVTAGKLNQVGWQINKIEKQDYQLTFMLQYFNGSK